MAVLKSNNLPLALVPLIPAAEKWGLPDDVERESAVVSASVAELEQLVHSIDDVSDDELFGWLAGSASHEPCPTDEYIAMTCLTLAIDSAKVRLRRLSDSKMIVWQRDWRAFDAPEGEDYFLRELQLETGDMNRAHKLHAKKCRILGWRERGWKHFILHIPADDRYAFIHLTWSKETDPRWPNCELLDDVDAVNQFLREWGHPSRRVTEEDMAPTQAKQRDIPATGDLPPELSDEVRRLSADGEELLERGSYEQALGRFMSALALLPSPQTDWPEFSSISMAIGDANYLLGHYSVAWSAFQDVMKSGDFSDNPFVRLRLGQCLFELDDHKEAANWLTGAYLMAGKEIFASDDPKYLNFIKSQLKAPPGGWPEGW